MKIAICYSGQYRTFDGWQKNHFDNLPDGDRYYSTWTTEKDFVETDDMIYFDEPIVDYNLYDGSFAKEFGAYIQEKPDEKKRLYTAAHQHFAHWNILQKLNDSYDVVIRMRYDTFLGQHKKALYNLCKLVNDTGIAIGVGNAGAKDDSNKEIHMMSFTEHKSNNKTILDFMTIHKPKNIANLIELHKKKQMWPTNSGWWLILSKPGFGHKNYRGGIQLARLLDKEIEYGK